jgi:hypothetical protein
MLTIVVKENAEPLEVCLSVKQKAGELPLGESNSNSAYNNVL